MKKKIQELLITVIKEALAELELDKSCPSEIYLDFPTDTRFGDLSTNIALQLSRQLKKNPREIAENLTPQVKKYLEKHRIVDYIKEVKVEGAGFINFYFHHAYFYEELKAIIAEGKEALKLDLGGGRRVLLEFVSANPTGPLSVAHARQAVVGDTLANLLESLNFKVKREFYLNDEGNQINILGSSVELRLKELGGARIEFPEDHYQGEYIYEIAKEAQNAKRKPQNLGDYAAGYILNIIKKELSDFGVKFDYWYSQKELRKSGKIKKALDYLEDKGFLYKEEGALWFRSTQFGDDKDRVVIKSDGSYTYLAPDIAYHRDKYARGFSWLINLWGPDHHGYISRLKAAVQALGHDVNSISVIIVQLATIFRGGLPVQMSTRRGQYITLREILDDVGPDAARFFFLMRRTSSHLDFDLSVAKKQTPENPVYYVQYAHARICSILRASPLKINLKALDLRPLKEKEELDLIKKLVQMPSVLNICLNTVDPYMLTAYLQEVAEGFHKFYDLYRVLGGDAELTAARLGLIEGVRIVIAFGLELLGISRPEKM